MNTAALDKPLWTPSPERVADAVITRFIGQINARHGLQHRSYDELWRWSTANPEAFWTAVWDFGGVIAQARGDRVLVDGDQMPGARFFPDARLNFAENLLRSRADTDALLFWGEDKVKRRVSHRELRDSVSRLQQALAAAGVGEGDRVAAFMPNMPETVFAMLAAASLGATFTSASPDFGVQGVVDRFGQVEPKVLFCCDGYFYNGKTVETLSRAAEFMKQLPSVRQVVVVRYVGAKDIGQVPRSTSFEQFIANFPAREPEFRPMPFNHPLYILYSSGTTGVPKCIVHGAGGVLLMHLKEHLLHCDVKPGDRLFYFTTCGWMMWNWLVTGLAAGATLLLYDGSPFVRRGNILFDFAQAERMTQLGTSAKFIDAAAKAGVDPARTHDLGSLRTILSTGSPLAPEGFDYVYARVKRDVCLSSISGGTDLVACFAGGAPILPVWRGELQCRLLGMQVEIFDDDGSPLPPGQKGELVCTAPFPTMPLGFWNDPGDAKYRAAYYERFPGVWRHGDWSEITPHGGLVIYGRSDAVLNPGGVRIGTAEIYRQVEKLDEIIESIVIGQDWQGDVRVVLFVRLREGLALDDALVKRIREVIRTNTTPRHVPAVILQVPDIPRTKSNKIVELAVRAVVHGQPVKNVEALANPEALEHFRGRPELGVC
jgi:acetoacetyl-CoA synthetase